MKKIFIALITLSLAACSGEKTPSTGTFGEPFDEKGATPVTEANIMPEDEERVPVKVSGIVAEVCQGEGCWLTLSTGDGLSIRVDAKDHAFTLPKDCSGKTAIVNGVAFSELVSVEQLKHLAKDRNAPQEEIDAIDAPGKQLVIEASGIIIK